MADKDITDNVAGSTRIVLKNGQSITDAQRTAMRSVSTLKTYLLANGYTAAQLTAMSKNDMIYAYRLKQNLV